MFIKFIITDLSDLKIIKLQDPYQYNIIVLVAHERKRTRQ